MSRFSSPFATDALVPEGFLHPTPTDADANSGAAHTDDGELLWAAESRPFGEIHALLAGTDDYDPGIRFPGQWALPDRPADTSDLYYNAYRWYRGGWGRYSQSDPIGLDGGVNLFRYGANNPLRFSDPLGLRVQLYCAPVGADGSSRIREAIGNLGFGHCFVRVKCACEGEGGPYDLRLEVTGRDRRLFGPDQAEIPESPPSFAQGHHSSIVPITPSDNDDNECTTENCLVDAYHRHRESGYEYGYYIDGPNSNTFADELLRGCGITKIYWPDGIPPFS